MIGVVLFSCLHTLYICPPLCASHLRFMHFLHLLQADKISNTLDQMEHATREITKVTQASKSSRKEPFYPAPNLTHKPRARTSVRQGHAVGTVNQVVGGFDEAAQRGYAEGFSEMAARERYDGSNKCTREDRQQVC